MIRINLLPIKKQQDRDRGRRQLALFALFLAVEVVLLYFLYSNKSGELEVISAENNIKFSAINDLKKQVADVEKLTKEKGLLEQQIGVLDGLEAGRSGPVRVLDEVLLILAQPRNDLERLTFQKRGWNDKWDPSRLWFNTFVEEGGQFGLTGGARTTDDVAEFLQRMSTSVYFDNVRLARAEAQLKDDFEYVTFEISGNISYSLGGVLEEAVGGK